MNSVYNKREGFYGFRFSLLTRIFRQNRKLKTNATQSDNRCSCFAYRKDLMKLTDTPAPDSILILLRKKLIFPAVSDVNAFFIWTGGWRAATV